MKKLLALLLLAFSIQSCSSGNLDDVKSNADIVWRENGFEIVGYQGFQWGFGGCFGASYGGAKVWYRLKSIPDNGIVYQGALIKWGNEYHVYNLTAIDAVKP